MGALQKVPTGLLAALGLKTLGRSPTELSDTLVGMVDALEMYLLTQQEVITQDLSQVWANGQSLAAIVPAGVAWRVRAASGELFLQNASTLGGDGITLSLGSRHPLRDYWAVQHYPTPAATALSASRFFTVGTTLGRPILLLPGNEIFVQFDGGFTSAGATFARVRALVEILPL